MPNEVNWKKAYSIERQIADIMARQELAGWKFDLPVAQRYVNELTEMRDDIYSRIRPHLHKILKQPYAAPVNKPFKLNGDLSAAVSQWYHAEEAMKVGGPFSRIEWLEPNLDSDKQLKSLLFELGWKPTQWNYKKDKAGRVRYDENRQPIKTSPRLTEDSYSSLTVGIGPDIARYLQAGHRCSQIEGWISNVDEDGFIHAAANPLGTPTGRMRHRIVVNVPKAKEEVFFGREMRGLFIVRDGRVLVGHDASGLEARLLGHFLNDPDLIHELIDGDFHTKFWEPIKDFIATRDDAKNIEYAFIYGARDKKLGSMTQMRPSGWGDEKVGKAVRKIIEEQIPALGELMEKVKRASKRGYLIGLDGRKLFIRSPHRALNLAIQGAGAVVMKISMCYLNQWVQTQGLDVIKVGDFHDESQADVFPGHAHRYGNLAVRSIIQAGQILELNCPLDAEYKIGRSWAETH